jgi:D-inositol-3-phosphate glycosyltransferase
MTTNNYSNSIAQLEQNLRLSDPPHPKNSPSTYFIMSLQGDPLAYSDDRRVDGHSIYVRDLGISLARQGHQVDIFTRRAHPDLTEVIEIYPGCRMIRLNVGPAKVIPRIELVPYIPALVEARLAFQLKSHQKYTLIPSNYELFSLLEIIHRQSVANII